MAALMALAPSSRLFGLLWCLIVDARSLVAAMTIEFAPFAPKKTSGPVLWRHATIDYSAANDYIQAHYQEESRYFSHVDESQQVQEPIYNARGGFWDDSRQELVLPSLAKNGFCFHSELPTTLDCTNVHQIQSTYLPQLRHVVLPTAFANENISDIVFWHAMLRGEDQVIAGSSADYSTTSEIPTGTIAPLAHIDTDVGAFDSTDEIVGFIDKNRLNDAHQSKHFSADKLKDALRTGRRFAIVNVWRNANPDAPITSAPLAFLSTRYPNNGDCFPKARPDLSQSRWYSYPRMTHDECLIFLQFDRQIQRPSDLWHCALADEKDMHEQSTSIPRRSLDVRALVLFEEVVPPTMDRLAVDRIRPSLSRRESECFCREQADQYLQKRSETINSQ